MQNTLTTHTTDTTHTQAHSMISLSAKLLPTKLIWFGILIVFYTQLLSHSFSNMLLAFH